MTTPSLRTAGTASLEAVLVGTFLLIPFIYLSIYVLLAANSSHNAITSARYGAIVLSLDNEQRYEGRPRYQRQKNGRDPVRLSIGDADAQVRETIAYNPEVSGRMLRTTASEPVRSEERPPKYDLGYAPLNAISGVQNLARQGANLFSFATNPVAYSPQQIEATATSRSPWAQFGSPSDPLARSLVTHEREVYWFRRSPEHYDDRFMESHQLARSEFHIVNGLTSANVLMAIARNDPGLDTLTDCLNLDTLVEDVLDKLSDTCSDLLLAFEESESDAEAAVRNTQEKRDDAQIALNQAQQSGASAGEISRLQGELNSAQQDYTDAQNHLTDVRDSRQRATENCEI